MRLVAMSPHLWALTHLRQDLTKSCNQFPCGAQASFLATWLFPCMSFALLCPLPPQIKHMGLAPGMVPSHVRSNTWFCFHPLLWEIASQDRDSVSNPFSTVLSSLASNSCFFAVLSHPEGQTCQRAIPSSINSFYDSAAGCLYSCYCFAEC